MGQICVSSGWEKRTAQLYRLRLERIHPLRRGLLFPAAVPEGEGEG